MQASPPSRWRSFAAVRDHDDFDLRARITAEFHEMPGMRLTLAQAARLFSLDLPRCERVLALLVSSGVLTTDGQAFARADTGRSYL